VAATAVSLITRRKAWTGSCPPELLTGRLAPNLTPACEAADRARARRLLKKYGITTAEYDQMFEAQGGKCAICRRPPKRIRLAVDHDHKGTGRKSVRGLLCSMCNRKIVGVIERFKVLPEKIVEYLRSERPFSC
jgi:hypothetical protein